MKKSEASSVVIIDSLFIFGVLEYINRQGKFGKVTMNYRTLIRYLLEGQIIGGLPFRKPEKILIECAISSTSEPQRRFTEMLRGCGYLVQEVDYSRTYIFPAPTAHLGREGGNGVASLSPTIAYLLGMISGRKNPQVLVVSGCISLFDPLVDFVKNRGGKAGIVFFKRFLDPEWMVRGLGNEDFPIKFYDLAILSKDLLGIDSFTQKDTKQTGVGIL